MDNSTKQCNICKKSKPITEYYTGAAKCKPCNIEYVKQYRKDNIDKIREYDRNRPNYKERIKNNTDKNRLKRENDVKWVEKQKNKKTPEDIREYKAKYYIENKTRLALANKKWVEQNIDKRREVSREWNKKNRETCNKNNKTWKEKNRYKTRTHDKIKHAIIKNKIVRPQNCEHCNASTKLHGHHHDYNKPLDVIWLCPSCHSAEHRHIETHKSIAL